MCIRYRCFRSKYPLMKTDCNYYLFEPEQDEYENLKINYKDFQK